MSEVYSHSRLKCFENCRKQFHFRYVLAIPEEMELFTIMPYGYPTPAAAAAGKQRKSLDEIAHRERFGQPYA